jgi:hypothetical protein
VFAKWEFILTDKAVKPVQPDKGKIQVQNTFFKSVLDPLPLADQYF